MKSLHVINQYADVSDPLHRHTLYCDLLSDAFDSVCLHYAGPVRSEKTPSISPRSDKTSISSFSTFHYQIGFTSVRILGWLEFFVKVLIALFCQINFKTPYRSTVIIYSSHVQPFALLIPILLRFLCPFSRVVSILELRDLWPESIAPLVPFSKNSLLYSIFVNYFNTCYRFSQRVIFLAPKALNYYSSVREKALILPNPVPFSAPLINSEISQRKQSISFCYSGAMNEINNVDFLLDALLKFYDKSALIELPLAAKIEFHLVGGGRLSEQVREFVRNANSFPLIEFHYHGVRPKSYALAIERSCHYSLAPIRPQPVHRFGNSQNKIVSACFSRNHIIYTGVNGTDSLIDFYPYKSLCSLCSTDLSSLLISKCISTKSIVSDFHNGIAHWSPPARFSPIMQAFVLSESFKDLY